MKFISILAIVACATIVSAAPHRGDTDVHVDDHAQDNHRDSQIIQNKDDSVTNAQFLSLLQYLNIPINVLSHTTTINNDAQQAKINN